MATKDLRELRLKYKAAFTTYMRSVQVLSDASHNGDLPAAGVLQTERRAFDDLTAVRQALLSELKRHAETVTASGAVPPSERTARSRRTDAGDTLK
jgi:hypothetical protein